MQIRIEWINRLLACLKHIEYGLKADGLKYKGKKGQSIFIWEALQHYLKTIHDYFSLFPEGK